MWLGVCLLILASELKMFGIKRYFMSFAKVFRNLFLGALALLSSQSLFASAFEELSDNDQYKLKAGQQVRIYTYFQSPYAAWPQGTIYQRIDATPEQAAAVFFDFNRHAEYLPHVLTSEVSSFIDKTTFQVDYSVGIPYFLFGLAKERYSLEYHLEFNASEASYSIVWHLTRSGHFTEYSQGSIRFEPMASGGTLMAYDSFVLPYFSLYVASSNTLGVALSKMVLKSVVNHIVSQIKKEQTMESVRLDLQVKALKKALGQ
jgi:hypothetical protein